MICRSIALFAVVAVFSGCVTDYTRGQASVCEVHGLPMVRQRVEIRYGLPSRQLRDVERVAATEFPNAGRPVLGGCKVHPLRTAAIDFVCPACQSAAERWQRDRRTLTDAAAIRIANAAAKRYGADLRHFHPPSAEWDAKDDTWLVQYQSNRPSPPRGSHFAVTVHDKTRRTYALGGR